MDTKRHRKRTATNDFRWIETNELCELKSLAKADFGKIADRITKAVRSAKENHDVVKDCFVIDLGQSKRKDKLVHQLEKYNDREWKSADFSFSTVKVYWKSN